MVGERFLLNVPTGEDGLESCWQPSYSQKRMNQEAGEGGKEESPHHTGSLPTPYISLLSSSVR